jgi:crotonobetainyl-CoA:carnitine CoA-transferase CaiB-like acyl-CoA transferase
MWGCEVLVGPVVPVSGGGFCALDIATDEGCEIMLGLVDRADVFITNIRPGGLRRLGMDPGSLLERNPRLVYGQLTGYGADGPAADRAGYDIGAFWSRAGVAGAFAGSDEPPILRPAMGDHTTGLWSRRSLQRSSTGSAPAAVASCRLPSSASVPTSSVPT